MDMETLARKYYPQEGSHGWNHIEDVRNRAKAMVSNAGEKWTPEMEAAVLFHDSGLYPNGINAPEVRDLHESRGAAVARKVLKDRFSPKALNNIANAINEHRASYKGEFTSPISDLVSSADRTAPDIKKLINRSYAYGKEHGFSEARAYRNILECLKEKYGTGGYARYPKHYTEYYGDAIKDVRDSVDKLSISTIKKVLGK